MNTEDITLYQKEIIYPYKALESRAEVILSNMNKLQKGMDAKQVVELLTAPDEVNPTYKYIKSKSGDNVNGFSLVYLFERQQETGSVNGKAEKLVRIHFDNSGKLIWAFSVNVDGFNAIERE